MTGISWMLQEAGSCPPADYLVYDAHGEEGGSGDQVCSKPTIIITTSLPYFGVKLSCVCLMFAYRKK